MKRLVFALILTIAPLAHANPADELLARTFGWEPTRPDAEDFRDPEFQWTDDALDVRDSGAFEWDASGDWVLVRDEARPEERQQKLCRKGMDEQRNCRK